MLTPDQQKWINSISSESKITILPLDPTAQETFERFKSLIHPALGESTPIHHRGATSLGISGQDEIDVYIPVALDQFDHYIAELTKLFGEPRGIHPGDRIRFGVSESGKKIDLFLINKEGLGWLKGVKFEGYLKTHPEALEEYRILKEEGNGLSAQEYYRRKIEFINEILDRAR